MTESPYIIQPWIDYGISDDIDLTIAAINTTGGNILHISFMGKYTTIRLPNTFNGESCALNFESPTSYKTRSLYSRKGRLLNYFAIDSIEHQFFSARPHIQKQTSITFIKIYQIIYDLLPVLRTRVLLRKRGHEMILEYLEKQGY